MLCATWYIEVKTDVKNRCLVNHTTIIIIILNHDCIIMRIIKKLVSRDSLVSTAVATGWMVGSSNPRREEIFRTRPDQSWDPPSPIYSRYRFFSGDKVAGTWRWPPTPSIAEIQERVVLYLYFPFGPSWSVLGWILTLLLFYLKKLTGNFAPHIISMFQQYNFTFCTKQLVEILHYVLWVGMPLCALVCPCRQHTMYSIL
jgi:hypothetical protein